MAKLKWASAVLPEPYYLPFPSFGINRALGGEGLESGRIHVYWGGKGSGKTTTALQQIAAAQKEGKVCAYVDAERAFSTAWAIKNGVDVEALKYIRANTMEQILELLMPEIEKEQIDIIVVDSVNSILFDGAFDPDKNPIGVYARSAKAFTHKLLSVLGTQQHYIFISHQSMDMSGSYPMLTAAIGNAVDHWASTKIKFQKLGGKDSIKDEGLAYKVKWTIEKSKQSIYPVKGEYWFDSRTAEMDKIAELGSYAIDEGIISQGGAWFYFPDKETCGDNKWHGADAFYEQLKYDLTLQNEVVGKLMEIQVTPDEEYADE